MKILAVNVNTTAAMSEQIADAARAVVREGTEIVEVTPRVGAESVEGNFESYLCAVAVMDSVATYPDAFDAVIQCGFGEHGVEGLREIVDVPVVDMTEAAAHFAMLLGNRFTIVTTLDRAVPLIEERLLSFGLDRHCANVRSTSLSVLELEDQERAKDAIREQARIALLEDHAEVIVLGCGGMAGLDRELTEQLNVPVVEGVACAALLAQDLVDLGLTTSKIRTYAPPRPKRVANWPISRTK